MAGIQFLQLDQCFVLEINSFTIMLYFHCLTKTVVKLSLPRVSIAGLCLLHIQALVSLDGSNHKLVHLKFGARPRRTRAFCSAKLVMNTTTAEIFSIDELLVVDLHPEMPFPL
jgi:hypothetical protein